MSIMTITLSNQGQVVIPQEICDQLHWEAGHELIIETTAAGVLLTSRRKEKPLRLEDLRGFLKSDAAPLSLEALCKPVEYGNDWEAK